MPGLGISQAAFFKWKQKYGGMTISEAKRLRMLESENARLKKLLSERTLELDALQDVLKSTRAFPLPHHPASPGS